MTVHYRDLSQYNGGSGLRAGDPVVICRATIGGSRDTGYAGYRSAARASGLPFGGYHFLDSPSLGVSVNVQADLAYSVIGPGVPAMLDLEPNRGYCASLSQGLAWIRRYRANGGTCNLIYLPRWSWSGWMGLPSLTPLRDLGVALVSSNYPSAGYSEGGPGWAAYGGVAPQVWQWTSTPYDTNAFCGSPAQLLALISGGHMAAILADYNDPLWAAVQLITNGSDRKGFATNRKEGQDAAGLAAGTYNIRVVVEKLAAQDAADQTRDAAMLAAVQALATSAGGDIDAAPIVAAIQEAAEQARAQESATVASLHEEIDGLRRALADALGKASADLAG